jgi:CheY-like chemotaxis protein/anti-sigma regulatory factor (Ser/Thr protein kinase)
MIRLVNDLLDLSAAQAGSFQLHERPCDLSSVVKDSLDGMWLRADAKGLILRVDVKCSSTEIVWCDPERFHQVVANLVSNAIKFTNSGWVKVSFAAIESSGKDQRYRLTVSDSGPGIAPGAQALLFKPFERLGAGGETEGSGLGLALTRMICSAMKGTLEVSSDGFSGSTLTAEFNLRSAAGYTFNRMPSPTLASTLPQPSRVLVVDDHKLVRGLFREWLEQAGILVTEASNGLEALKKINSEEPDVLLLDWSMPGLDGIQLTRRLRSMSQGRQRLRIVGVSAHAGVEERGKALAVGMDVFLLKPVDRMDLLMAVKGAVEQPEEDCSKRIRRTDFFRRQFLEDAPEKLRDLEMSASRGEFVRVVELAHDLTNAAFALQDKVLGDASAALETAARCQSPEIRKFASEVASAVRALEKPFVASIPAALPKRQIQSESTIP